MAKEGFSWANLLTILVSIGGSLVANYYGAGWALDAKMYEQAMIGANEPQTPLAMRLYYIRIIAKWEGMPLTPAEQKEIAESYIKKPDASLESLAPENPAIKNLVKRMNSTTFLDTWYDIDKSQSPIGHYDVVPESQPSGTKLDELPSPGAGSRDGTSVPKADQLPADGKSNQFELKKQK